MVAALIQSMKQIALRLLGVAGGLRWSASQRLTQHSRVVGRVVSGATLTEPAAVNGVLRGLMRTAARACVRVC